MPDVLNNISPAIQATIKAFTLALNGLPLWLLISMEVRKFHQYHGYVSMAYPNTWILWFKRKMDLELMFSSVMSLRTAKWNKWTKLFTDLLALVLAYTVSILTETSFTFFQRSEWNTFTFLSLYISHVLMEKSFTFNYIITHA